MLENKYFRFFAALILTSLHLVPYEGKNLQLWISLIGYLLWAGLIIWIIFTSGSRKPLIWGIVVILFIDLVIAVINLKGAWGWM